MTQELAQSTEFQVALQLDGLSTDGINQHHLGGFMGASPLSVERGGALMKPPRIMLLKRVTHAVMLPETQYISSHLKSWRSPPS